MFRRPKNNLIKSIMEGCIIHLNIKSLAEGDRPREKFAGLGRHSLSDAELIAIILGSGSRNETAVQLAQRILSSSSNNINELAKLSLNDLKKFRGVGEVKAINIAAAFELGRRRRDTRPKGKVKITSSHDAYEFFHQRLSDLSHEEFRLVLLDRANQILKEEYLSKGGVSGTVVDIRLICKIAVEHAASGVIIAHNHPSGQVLPSEQDKSITRKLKDALRLFDISLLDHVIIGDRQYFSFSDDGQL
jgi:DNA repair protein RadC